MKTNFIIKSIFLLVFTYSTGIWNSNSTKDFQGKAYYYSKSTMSLGNWGARLSEAQKKQVMNRLKGRLEKRYILTFNKKESVYYEEEMLDAVSGATDSWGKNFTPGKQYKNVVQDQLVQVQEFYGKKFLVKDKLQKIDWKIGTETKQIGNYVCIKATAMIPTNDLTWYSFSWGKLRNTEENNDKVKMTIVEAWYTPQIPINNGPGEYWGLPGLILEVSAGDTTLLCYKLVLNSKDEIAIDIPKKGEELGKNDYQKMLLKKMKEFRDIRMSRRRRS